MRDCGKWSFLKKEAFAGANSAGIRDELQS
jgi:hypothetical protein